jgi:hypothetical protein
MTRRVVAALVLWTAAVAVLALLFGGGTVAGCLGPLGVTAEQCRAAMGLPPETAWDHITSGLVPWGVILVVGWVAIVGTDRWWMRRQRGGL